MFYGGGKVMPLDNETYNKIQAIDKRLNVLQKRKGKTEISPLTIQRLIEDLSFVIGKLSSIYEILIKSISNKEKD
tara:strand:- start:20105 stop:20329 length:225 start_codon:yes stop_codon:yes gene_type:complete